MTDIPDLKYLEKLIALCRKKGVTVVKVGGLELTLSEDAPVSKPRGKAANKPKEDANPPESFDTLSPEDQLFYSSSMNEGESS